MLLGAREGCDRGSAVEEGRGTVAVWAWAASCCRSSQPDARVVAFARETFEWDWRSALPIPQGRSSWWLLAHFAGRVVGVSVLFFFATRCFTLADCATDSAKS